VERLLAQDSGGDSEKILDRQALNHRDPAKAVELPQPALPFELGWQGGASAGFSASLYVIYLRGQAYLAANRGAAAEFQKVIDNIGVVSNDPTVVVIARLELARAFASAGEQGKARAAPRHPHPEGSESGILPPPDPLAHHSRGADTLSAASRLIGTLHFC
jgi:hypothetical protein